MRFRIWKNAISVKQYGKSPTNSIRSSNPEGQLGLCFFLGGTGHCVPSVFANLMFVVLFCFPLGQDVDRFRGALTLISPWTTSSGSLDRFGCYSSNCFTCSSTCWTYSWWRLSLPSISEVSSCCLTACQHDGEMWVCVFLYFLHPFFFTRTFSQTNQGNLSLRCWCGQKSSGLVSSAETPAQVQVSYKCWLSAFYFMGLSLSR